MTVGAKDDNKDRLRVASALQLMLCLFSTVNLNGHGDKCKFKKMRFLCTVGPNLNSQNTLKLSHLSREIVSLNSS